MTAAQFAAHQYVICQGCPDDRLLGVNHCRICGHQPWDCRSRTWAARAVQKIGDHPTRLTADSHTVPVPSRLFSTRYV